MVRYLIVLFLILLTNFSFSQSTVILTQTQNDAIKGIDRKAWAGLGNTGPLSYGYANDFTLPASTNPCEKITNVKVDVKITGYSNDNACPIFQTYFNLFYGCTPYAGGATCLPIPNAIVEQPYSPTTSGATFNFNTSDPKYKNLDFGGNLSVDIIPVSNPCYPVLNGGLTYQYTTTVTVTITDISLILDIIDPAPVCSGATVNITLPTVLKPGSTTGTTLTYYTDAAATIALPNSSAITTSGTYYIKSTLGSCSIIKPVVVTIAPPVVSPVVTTPINLCVSAPTALIATPSVGHSLKWYGTAATGGTASSIATIPSATGTYYVSQTDGVCESSRVPIQVNLVADNGAKILNLRCDSSQLPVAERNSAVLFDWANDLLSPNDIYSYSYTIQGGSAVTGTTINSSLKVPGMLSGQSATIVITSVKFPCKPTVTETCTVPCVTTTTPDFPPITKVYCVGNTIPNLSNISPNGISGTWSPSNVISNAASGTYIFTPDPILFPCALPQTLNVTVNPIASPTFSGLAISVCENSIGQVLPTSSTNTIPITGTWGPSPSINTTILGSTIYTFIPDSGQCVSATPTTINVTVNSSAAPTFNPIPAFCAGTPTVPPLPTTSANTSPISGVWNPATIDNTATRDYEFTPNIGLHPCAPKTKLTVTVTPNVTPTFAVSDTQCEGSGILTLPNTSTNTPPISGTWDNNTIDTSIVAVNPRLFTATTGSCVISPTTPKTITVYSSALPTFVPIPDFCSGTPSPPFPLSNEGIAGSWLPNTISNAPGTKNYQFTPDTAFFPCAPIPLPLSVTVLPSVTPTFSPGIPTYVCEGVTLPDLPSASSDTPPITGLWSTVKGTTNAIDTSAVGTESYTFTPDSGQCATSPSPIVITVNPTNSLTGVNWTVTDAFSQNQTLTITATSSGNYLYQLDYGPFQSSPIFENVASGIHSVTVMDAGGCSAPITESNVLVINYPKFFTPNGDGFNDTWNIFGLRDQLNSRIYIFDRYGKLLKEISSDGQGWDGTYLGKQVPADDYWFTVDYIENSVPKKFKSHFSIKR